MKFQYLPGEKNHSSVSTCASSLDSALGGGLRKEGVTLFASHDVYASVFLWRLVGIHHAINPASILSILITDRDTTAPTDSPIRRVATFNEAREVMYAEAWANPSFELAVVDSHALGPLQASLDWLNLFMGAQSTPVAVAWIAKPHNNSDEIDFESLPRTPSGESSCSSLVVFTTPTNGYAIKHEGEPRVGFSILPYSTARSLR